MVRDSVSLNIPDSQKDERWHKLYCDSLISRSNFDPASLHEIVYAYDYTQGFVDAHRDHNYVITSENGVQYPVDFINFNEIQGFVDQLIGEAHRKGFELTTKAASKHALSRKRQAEIEMEVDFGMMELYARDQRLMGIPVMRPDMPMSEGELAEKKKNYKEQGELIYQRMLDYWVLKYRWKKQVDQLLEDAIVGGRCFKQSMLVNGFPKPEVLDPRSVIWDQSCTDPWLSDAQYVGWLKYMPLTRVQEYWHLTSDEVKQIETNGGQMVSLGGSEGASYRAVRNWNGEKQVLVARMEWKDTKKKIGFEYTSSTGVKHYMLKNEEIDPEDAKKKIDTNAKRRKASRVVQKDVEIVRQCTVIGGTIVRDWGPLENMVRTTDDWETTGFSITGYLPKWKFGRNVSIVQQLIPLQKLKDRALYYLMLAMKKDRGKFFANDVSQLPDDMTEADQMYVAEMLGELPFHSRRYGANSGYNQFQTIDLSLSRESVLAYVEIARLASAEMARITGIQPSRMGEIQAPTQAVGLTDISRQQSMLRTERFFEGFDIFTEMATTLVLGQMKIAFTHDPQKFAHIVGDEGIAFLQADLDFALDDYGTTVRTSISADVDKAAIQQMTSFAVQNGSLDYLMGLEVMLERNPREALETVRKFSEEQRARQQEAEQRMAAAQQAAMQQQQQAEDAKEQRKAEAQMESPRAMERIAENNNATKLMIENGKNTMKAVDIAARNRHPVR